MNRRELLACLVAGGVITAAGLWMPGQRLISIPSDIVSGPFPKIEFRQSSPGTVKLLENADHWRDWTAEYQEFGWHDWRANIALPHDLFERVRVEGFEGWTPDYTLLSR